MNFTEKLNLLTTQSQSQIEKSKKVQAMLAGSLDLSGFFKPTSSRNSDSVG